MRRNNFLVENFLDHCLQGKEERIKHSDFILQKYFEQFYIHP